VKRLVAALLLASLEPLASPAQADQRFYVWTYEYKIVEPGETEIESYLTLSSPDAGNLRDNTTTELQLELEAGMTPRFDMSIYQVFRQKPGGALQFDKFKLRGRNILSQRGRHPFDPLLYWEYQAAPDFHKQAAEFKLILARDDGRRNLALNPILEFEKESSWEVEAKYAAGVSWALSRNLRAGLEFHGGEKGHYFGPVVNHGYKQAWITFGPAFRLGHVAAGEPELQLRMIWVVGQTHWRAKPRT